MDKFTDANATVGRTIATVIGQQVELLTRIHRVLEESPPDCLGVTTSIDDMGGDVGTCMYMRDALLSEIEVVLKGRV